LETKKLIAASLLLSAIKFQVQKARKPAVKPAFASHPRVTRRDEESIKVLKPCKSFFEKF
jgi:hypothetical protein